MTSIDVVTQEQILGVGHISAKLEEFEQIRKLPMDIATDPNRSLKLDNIGFSLQNFFSLK